MCPLRDMTYFCELGGHFENMTSSGTAGVHDFGNIVFFYNVGPMIFQKNIVTYCSSGVLRATPLVLHYHGTATNLTKTEVVVH